MSSLELTGRIRLGDAVIDLDKIAALEHTDPAAFKLSVEEIGRIREEQQQNPLSFFTPHSARQRELLEASTPIQAGFAGNRFGKTASLVVKALAQHTPREDLSDEVARFKVCDAQAGRILCPSEQVMVDVLVPEVQKWVSKQHLLGGGWDKAWDKAHDVLRFRDGSRIGFYTYKQDPSTMEGAALDYVAYDEPPPEPVRNACLARLADRDGFEFFALTPVNMKGGGIGWIYRKVWKQRESPDVTVVQGGGRDNPHISQTGLSRVLSGFSEEERRAREFGDFMHFGGMVYPGGFEHRLVPVPSPDQVKGLDIVVGVDPGLKKAAFVWIAFDSDNHAVVFDERMVAEGTPIDWAGAIRETNAKWGVTPDFVIDPSARNRSLVNAESVEGELGRQGIYCVHGQNDVFAGVSQVRRRLQEESLHFAQDCRGLRDEAEEYREQDRPDEEFKVVKENDHRLDACFVEGTLVETAIGPRYIQAIRPGDEVWTRKGLRKVVATGSRKAEVFDLEIPGHSLRGSGEHPIWTDRGWTRLDSVRYADKIQVWNQPESWWNTGEFDFDATPTRPTGVIGSISRRVKPIASRVCAASMRSFGSRRTARSPRVASSIMPMATPSTTASGTSWRSPLRITPTFTGPRSAPPPSGRGPMRFVRSLRLGTARPKAGAGTPNMPVRPMNNANPLSGLVTTAGGGSTPSLVVRMTASVPTPASRHGGGPAEWMTRIASALSAESPSESTGTPRPRLVRADAEARPARTATVYNLTVDDQPEYFANGVLVHNCRYALMHRPWYPDAQSDVEPLGWVPGTAPPQSWFRVRPEGAPMGSMS